jgi:tRNA threonylcarbamoyladenosine biosynthesis protein TsaB
MNLLAIDTATERCSIAARIGGAWFERSVDTQRGHADIVLTMIDQVLQEGAMKLNDLDGIAYGRGPGAFTGVRIAIGVVQGLAFGANLPTVGISNLAAVAQQVAAPNDRVLVCMDARMQEVYWAQFRCDPQCDHGSGLVESVGAEHLSAPGAVSADPTQVDVIAGSALSAYPQLAERFASARHVTALPRARDILLLGEREFAAGRGQSAVEAQPVYLRDQVTFVKTG